MILDRFQENGSKYVFVFSIVDNLQIQIVVIFLEKKSLHRPTLRKRAEFSQSLQAALQNVVINIVQVPSQFT